MLNSDPARWGRKWPDRRESLNAKQSDRSGRAGTTFKYRAGARSAAAGAGWCPDPQSERDGEAAKRGETFLAGYTDSNPKPEIMDNNALKGNSLQLQLHHLGVETESQTIDLVGSILHLLSYEAKQSVFNIVASHLEVTPNIENTNPENDLPH